MNWDKLYSDIVSGNSKSLARAISLVENDIVGYEQLLERRPIKSTPVIGITGPPGAGKSTMVDALINLLNQKDKKTAILCVDPSSPFNFGAILGDRIRMKEWYNNPNIFIRSLASRASLGGLSPKIMEICDVIKFGDFDYIFVETVGVGQSEIEIAGLADVTILVLVPEAGDEIQLMKSGVLEVADLFVVNKADRPGADIFERDLQYMIAAAYSNKITKPQVIKTTSTNRDGINSLLSVIEGLISNKQINPRKYWLLAEKAFLLIQKKRMQDVDKLELQRNVEKEGEKFNLYSFIRKYY